MLDLSSELACRRLSQKALAEELGVSPQAVNHWINGRKKIPDDRFAEIEAWLAEHPVVEEAPPSKRSVIKNQLAEDIKTVLDMTEAYVELLLTTVSVKSERETLELQMRRECMATIKKFYS